MDNYEIIPLYGLPIISEESIRKKEFQSILPLIHKIQEKDNKLAFKRGDILAICHTFLGKIYDATIRLDSIQPSKTAQSLAELCDKDPKLMQVILDNTQDLIRISPVTIVENLSGIIGANAGIDKSNVEGPNTFIKNPLDADNLAKKIGEEIAADCGFKVPILITDTVGRPFREGATGIAIGSYGIIPIKHYQGSKDLYGYKLQHSEIAIGDALASIADLAMGKSNEGIPMVILRNFHEYHDNSFQLTSKKLQRPAKMDMFRTWDWESVLKFRRSFKGNFRSVPIPPEIRYRLIEFASYAPSAHNSQPWKYIDLTEYEGRKVLFEKMAKEWEKDLKKDHISTNEINQKMENSFNTFTKAPVLFLVCLDQSKLWKYSDLRQDKERILGIQSVAASMMALQFAMEGMGLVGSWYSAAVFASYLIKTELKLPNAWEPQSLITVGYPEEREYHLPKRKSPQVCFYEMKHGAPVSHSFFDTVSYDPEEQYISQNLRYRINLPHKNE